jgi:hypothetical protein
MGQSKYGGFLRVRYDQEKDVKIEENIDGGGTRVD